MISLMAQFRYFTLIFVGLCCLIPDQTKGDFGVKQYLWSRF